MPAQFTACILAAVALIASVGATSHAADDCPSSIPPNPFVTDACTWAPDGTWSSCCVAHDRAYWLGGSWRQRMAADRELASCMRKHDRLVLGGMAFVFLRITGVSWLRTPFRWGWGWPYPQPGPPRRPAQCAPAQID